MQVDIMTVLCAVCTICLANWREDWQWESDADYEQRCASIANQCPLCRATTPQPEETPEVEVETAVGQEVTHIKAWRREDFR